MLKIMPVIGTILLTIIIVWIGVSTWLAHRRKISNALAGRSYCVIPNGQSIMPEARKSICCNAPTFRPRWSADGWIAPCQMCGEWQYLGDDHDNPPEDAITGVEMTLSDIQPENLARAFGLEVTSEITPYPHDCTCHPDERPAICQRRFALSDCLESFMLHMSQSQSRRFDTQLAEMIEDEGEPLPASMSHTPNVGGEGNPDYQGPHYLVDHNRFVPYDVLRDPPEGAAVHIVGNVACVGPLDDESQKDEGHAESAENNIRSD